jgi:hypothetical protein
MNALIPSSVKGRQCFADPNGDLAYFFGQGGYIEVTLSLGVIHYVAYINPPARKRPDLRLRTEDFSELVPGRQELVVNEEGLAGMLAYLKVPRTSWLQSKLKTFEDMKTAQNWVIKSNS